MVRKSIVLKTVALVVIFGPVAALSLGLLFDTLSPRHWAIGFLAWAATLPMLIIILRKWLAKKGLASSSEPVTTLDNRTRKRSLRKIWLSKVWIGLLAAALPFGFANGVAHRAWLPTLVGVGMNLLMMYVAILEIKRERKRLESNCQ